MRITPVSSYTLVTLVHEFTDIIKHRYHSAVTYYPIINFLSPISYLQYHLTYRNRIHFWSSVTRAVISIAHLNINIKTALNSIYNHNKRQI